MLMPTKLLHCPSPPALGSAALQELHWWHFPENHLRHTNSSFLLGISKDFRRLSLDCWTQSCLTTATILQPSGKKYNWVLSSSLGTINREWLIFCYKALATWVVICPSVLYVPDHPLLPSCCFFPSLCRCTRCKVRDIREPGRRASEPLTQIFSSNIRRFSQIITAHSWCLLIHFKFDNLSRSEEHFYSVQIGKTRQENWMRQGVFNMIFFITVLQLYWL